MEELRMNFGDILQKLRKDEKLKQEYIAKQIGVKKNTISNYENNISKPHYEQLVKLCNLFKVEPNYLMQDDITLKTPRLNPEDQNIIDKYKALTPHDKEIVDYIFKMESEEPIQYSDNTNKLINLGEIIPIDTYPQPVSAGKGNIYIDDNPVPKLYPATPISSKADYCVRISGESMYPNYLDGDYVYIDTKTKDLNNDDIGIFFYDGEAYCKKYYEDERIKKLISLNPDQERYSPIIIENNTFEVQGKVIGKFHAD